MCIRDRAGTPAIPSASWEGLVPDGDTATAQVWLRARLVATPPGHVLAVFSHQPFLGELVYRLTNENLEIKKASCTVVERQGDAWALREQFAPADLRALA